MVAATNIELSREEVMTFKEDGYLGPFTAVREDEMALIRSKIEQEVLTTDGPNPKTRTGSRHMDQCVIFDLATHPEIIHRVASIFGPDLIVWATSLWNKEPGGAEIPWHQDINFWPIEPPINISAWIAIDPVSVENSCVKVIPGSHRRPIPHIEADAEMKFHEMADPAYVDVDKAINMTLRPGQFFLFTERLLHQSDRNNSDKRRLGMSARISLPITQIDHDNPPLHTGHTAILALGEDRVGFNRYAGRPDC